MPQVTVFSTAGLRGIDKIAAWREQALPLTRDTLSGLHCSSSQFEGQIRHALLRDIEFFKMSVTPNRIVREGRNCDDGQDKMLRLILMERGSSFDSYRSQTIHSRIGYWSIYDEREPCVVEIPEDSEYTMVRLPRHMLEVEGMEVARLASKSFDATVGAGRILNRVVADLFEEMPNLNDAACWDIASSLSLLLKACIQSIATEDQTLSSRTVIRDRAKAYIKAHIRSRRLSPALIAQALHCSTRYVHKAFEVEGISISEYILQQRLIGSRELLLATGWQRRTITDVAMESGFSCSSQFSRAFRKHFGISPRELRTNWLQH